MDTEEVVSQELETTEQVKIIPNPTGKGGFGEHPENINAGGRPVNSLKSYQARKLANMSDEEKEQWLQEHKVSGIDQWKMAEGNPHQTTDAVLKGDDLAPILVKFIDGKTDNNRNTE